MMLVVLNAERQQFGIEFDVSCALLTGTVFIFNYLNKKIHSGNPEWM
jgi:hypothetical protein